MQGGGDVAALSREATEDFDRNPSTLHHNL